MFVNFAFVFFLLLEAGIYAWGCCSSLFRSREGNVHRLSIELAKKMMTEQEIVFCGLFCFLCRRGLLLTSRIRPLSNRMPPTRMTQPILFLEWMFQ